MLSFKCRICPTITPSSILSSRDRGLQHLLQALVAAQTFPAIKMPRAARMLFTLFFRAVRSLTSLSRVWSTWPSPPAGFFHAHLRQHVLRQKSANVLASCASVFFTERRITWNWWG